MPTPGWIRWVRSGSLAVIVVSLIALVRILPMNALVAELALQVDRLGVWGPLGFGLAYVLAALLFVPGSALMVAAGAVFGLGRGTVVISLASATAAGEADRLASGLC